MNLSSQTRQQPKSRTAHAAKRLALPVLIVWLMALSFFAGNLTGYSIQTAAAAEERPAEFVVFWEAWDFVVNHFVDRERVDFTAMTYGAIEGMLSSLGDDGHTTFLSPEAVEMHKSSLQGSFEGIGAYVSMEEGNVTIVAPIDGSPAEVAGILAGDVILAVDGEPIAGESLNQVISRIRGPADSEVILTVLHPDAEESVDISIIRGKIEINSVNWSTIPGTSLAYVEITQFSAETGQDLENALQAIELLPAVEGVVLDLRNNPGGFLREAIRVNSQFLPKGDVILIESDADKNETIYRSRGWGYGRDLPLAVLINEGTASAGEITAGALKENERAVLIGETTFGTGTVLNQFNLSDGSAILLGVTNWLTPQGNLIKNQGVTPDIEIAQPASAPLLDARALKGMDPAELAETDDVQFLKALEQLGVELTEPQHTSAPAGRTPGRNVRPE